MTISNENAYSGSNTYTAQIMRKMNTLSAHSMSGNVDMAERNEIESEMQELKGILVDVQNKALWGSNVDIARRLNSVDVTSKDVTSALTTIKDQSMQAIQAQANQSNEGVLSLLFV